MYLHSRFQIAKFMSYLYWTFRASLSTFSMYIIWVCARKIFLQAFLQFKVNSIENKMARGGFYEGTFCRAFSRCCSYFVTWILRRIFSSGSRRVGSKVPAFAHPMQFCHAIPYAMPKGRKRGRDREKAWGEEYRWTLSDHLLL